MNDLKPLYEDFGVTHPLNRYGYQVTRHTSLNSFEDLKIKFSNHLKERLIDHYNINSADDFVLENYHIFLEKHDINQHEFITKISRVLPESFANHQYILEMLEIAGKNTNKKFKIYKNKVEFRVVRPKHDDNNEFHRDHWFPYFTPLMNVYLPISGSNCDSAMCVVPFSHKWSDEDVKPTFTFEESKAGKKFIGKNGVAYSVPSIATSLKEIKPHRPDVLEGDFMLFSPLMIHGGGSNSSMNTRFSFEIRLEEIK